MHLKLSCVADIPNMVANPRVFTIADIHAFAGKLLADRNGFEDGTITVTTTSCVIDLSRSRVLGIVPEHVDQIVGVDIVADLLPLISQDRIRRFRNCTFDQIRKESHAASFRCDRGP